MNHDENEELKTSVERAIRRMKHAEESRRPFFSFTIYLGTLGLLVAIPVVFAAYLGVWLDRRFGTYFLTFFLIAGGAIIGMINVWLYMRR